ncbi:MAG: hypothetical protein ABIT08_11690 [Bacteroidia bacterium]
MRNLVHFLLAVLVLFPYNSFCQNFQYANINVQSVSFSGGNLNIRTDNNSGIYTAPQWLATNAIKSPVAYTSGNAPKVAASLTIDCATVPDSIYVRALASDSIAFTPIKVVVAGSATTVHSFLYPATTGSAVFASGFVRFFKPFTIDWQISFDNGITWKSVGITNNTLYVTRSAPQPETSLYKWFHTVFDISCRNAQYKSQDTAIISSVWNEFTDHVVLNYNDDSLFYYKAMNSPNVTLSALLQYRDAECYTFAQLFLSGLKIQGVVRTNNYVYITPINNSVCSNIVNRFIVKTWMFGNPSAIATCPDFPYENTYTNLMPFPYTAYNFDTADVVDQSGLPGSCTINPASYFNNHQITKIDGVYYDPCYGVTFNLLTDIKTAAFSGWGYRNTIGSTTHAFFANDMTQSDLMETITTF